jgi:GntP family gluconate:H+ symporter
VIGNPNLALLLSAGAAMLLYPASGSRRESNGDDGGVVADGARVVILIVAAGGAFGAMLQDATGGTDWAGHSTCVRANRWRLGNRRPVARLAVTSVVKVAQGSSTVAMITAAGSIGALVRGVPLPFHNVYLGTAIAAGSLVGSWMNDAGFWVFSKIGVVTEVETLRSWTPLLAVVGMVSLLTTLLMATVLPLM